MKYESGQSGNPAGKPKGATNKISVDIKEAFQSLVEGNLSNVEKWINEVAEKDPARAVELIIKLTEYILPKMKAADKVEQDEKPERIIVVRSPQCAEDIRSLQ